FAASASYRQVVLKQSFEGIPVASVMKHEPVTVSPELTAAELVEDYFYRYYYKMFPVVEGGHLLGSVGLNEVKKVKRDQWATTRIRDILTPASNATTVTPETNAMAALSLMQKTGNGRLCVTVGDRLQGILTRKDMLEFLSLRLDLEGEAKDAGKPFFFPS
ncbi:MAG: CBS domain-containing protein, partial [Alphaproteobacteria bacterium]